MMQRAPPARGNGYSIRAEGVGRQPPLASIEVSIHIRRATEKDLDLVTWVMLAASRSHLDRGIWEYMNDTDEAATLSFIRRLATTEAVHMFHHSLFLVAELDGEPGAAMCA